MENETFFQHIERRAEQHKKVYEEISVDKSHAEDVRISYRQGAIEILFDFVNELDKIIEEEEKNSFRYTFGYKEHELMIAALRRIRDRIQDTMKELNKGIFDLLQEH